jgi:hypothetical protein
MRQARVPSLDPPDHCDQKHCPDAENARRDVQRVADVVDEADARTASVAGVCARRDRGENRTDRGNEVSHGYSLCSAEMALSFPAQADDGR